MTKEITQISYQSDFLLAPYPKDSSAFLLPSQCPSICFLCASSFRKVNNRIVNDHKEEPP
jgi:hypothetical protein